MSTINQTPHAPETPEAGTRQAAMALAGQANADDLRAVLARIGIDAAAEDLRRPETGLVMVRGRIGGDGRAFNVGEATITRAAVRLPSGETGFAYHLGRDRTKARLAAILDAHWQRAAARPAIEDALAALAERRAAEAVLAARQVAATRVTFFTLARGED